MSIKLRSKTKRITMPSGSKATVRGVCTVDGTPYVYVRYRKAEGYVPHDMFVGQKAEARTLLKQQRVLIITDADWNQLIDAVDRIRRFHDKPLIEQTGWTGPYFALRDGTVFGPPDEPEGIAIFPKVAESFCAGGSLDRWREQIAVHLTGQHLLIAAVLAGLASPMVAVAGEKQNFGFELSGPPETGKSTWLNLFASAAMRPAGIPTFHSTRTGQEDMFGEFRDMPFPVDEANLADSSDRQFVKDFAFRMANGVPKITRNQPDRAQYRFVFATTANEPIRDALGKLNGDTSDAALQRLLPLRVDSGRPEGVFSFIPDRFGSPGAFATYLGDTIEVQYGTPIRAFLRALVIARSSGPERLVANIRRKIAQFEEAAGLSATLRGKSRATSAFGLLYAAGSFAKAKGILPESWDCMVACLSAYRNYQSCLPDQTPLATRLLTIAQRPETLDLRAGAVPELSDAQLAKHGAFLKVGKGARIELLVDAATQRQFFPDWKQLKQHSDFKACNLSAKDHDGQQRQVRKSKKKERFACFILTPDLVEQLDQ